MSGNPRVARQTEQPDRIIAQIARRQRGYITRAQLLEAGLSDDAIDRRIARGQLIRVHRGVYAVGHLPAWPVDRAAAAVLACGHGAALSHSSAMALWGFSPTWRAPFEVTPPSAHQRPGILVHRSKALISADLRRHLGIRVTSPARTILDATPELGDRALARTFDNARLSGHLHLAATAELLGRFPRHPGATRLARLVDPGRRPTRSELEDVFLAFLARYDLPQPQVNVRVRGREVDALFAAERVIVELDGYRFHDSRRSFEADRERDADNLVAGLITVRITWERLTERAAAEARRLERILRTRRSALLRAS